MKALKGNRTRIVNIIAAAPVALEVIGQVANLPEITGIIPPAYLPAYGLGLAVVNILLRQITTTPPGKKL